MFRLSKRITSTIVQVAICVILFPFACIIIKVIFPNTPEETFVNMVSQIPIMEVWFDIIRDLLRSGDLQDGIENYLNEWSSFLAQTTVQLYLLATITEITKIIFQKIKLMEPAILPNVISVLFWAILLRFTPEKMEYILTEILILLVVYLTIIFFFSKVSFAKKLLKLIFGIGYQTVVVCAICAYICCLAMIANGTITALSDIVVSISVTFSFVFVLLLCDYLFLRQK